MNLFKKLLKEPETLQAQPEDTAQTVQIKTPPQRDSGEAPEDFVYHFTGKLNQSQVLKTADGEIVYEAICEKAALIKDTAYQFVDHGSGTERTIMIGHTVTLSVGLGGGFSANISSTFKVDGVSVWEVLSGMGYGFHFRMNGLTPHYEITRYGSSIGYAESAGTGAMNPKYANNPLGKMPTKGIFRVHCRRSDIPGVFLICFALSRTDQTLG